MRACPERRDAGTVEIEDRSSTLEVTAKPGLTRASQLPSIRLGATFSGVEFNDHEVVAFLPIDREIGIAAAKAFTIFG